MDEEDEAERATEDAQAPDEPAPPPAKSRKRRAVEAEMGADAEVEKAEGGVHDENDAPPKSGGRAGDKDKDKRKKLRPPDVEPGDAVRKVSRSKAP